MSLILNFFGNRRSNNFDPFSLEIWDGFPFAGAVADVEGLARDASAFAAARIDWKETPEAHVFKADLPGLNEEEVKVEVEEGRVLQISGERSSEKEEKNEKWHLLERSSGKFLRRFRLPEDAKMDEIKAAMENGVLTVTVPKGQLKKPEVKAIDISGYNETRDGNEFELDGKWPKSRSILPSLKPGSLRPVLQTRRI